QGEAIGADPQHASIQMRLRSKGRTSSRDGAQELQVHRCQTVVVDMVCQMSKHRSSQRQREFEHLSEYLSLLFQSDNQYHPSFRGDDELLEQLDRETRLRKEYLHRYLRAVSSFRTRPPLIYLVY